MKPEIERHAANPNFASTTMRSSSDFDASIPLVHRIDTLVG